MQLLFNLFLHSFLWEKGVWSEDEKFDMTRDVQAPAIQKVDCAIQWINLYPIDNAVGFSNAYPLRHRDFSGGQRHTFSEQLGPDENGICDKCKK